ncbi:MAG TPA: zinc ribbon domain-containing protein [Candidatus Anoxymicrobiaceae bacterium]
MAEGREGKAVACRCPYCDVVVEEESVICVVCKTVIIDCEKCGAPMREGAEACPKCGEPAKKK